MPFDSSWSECATPTGPKRPVACAKVGSLVSAPLGNRCKGNWINYILFGTSVVTKNFVALRLDAVDFKLHYMCRRRQAVPGS